MSALQIISLKQDKHERQDNVKCYVTPDNVSKRKGFDIKAWAEGVLNSEEALGKKVIMTYPHLFGVMICIK